MPLLWSHDCALVLLSALFPAPNPPPPLLCPLRWATPRLQVAQYQILVTFLGALIIKTDALGNMSDLSLGAILLAVNIFILFLAAYMGYSHYKREMQERVPYSSTEFEIIHEVMDKPSQEKADQILRQLLLDPRDVRLTKKIGSGSFGAVYATHYCAFDLLLLPAGCYCLLLLLLLTVMLPAGITGSAWGMTWRSRPSKRSQRTT